MRSTWSSSSVHSGVARLYEARLVGEDNGLYAVPQIELLEQARDVRRRRVLADDELGRDLGVREAARDEAQHLSLARRQGVKLALASGTGSTKLDQPPRDGGREERAAVWGAQSRFMRRCCIRG
jgi:hypothetical protein